MRCTILKKAVNSSLFQVRLAFHFPPNETKIFARVLNLHFRSGTCFIQEDIFKVFVLWLT